MHSYSLVVVHHLVFHSAPTLLSPPRCDDSSFWISFCPLISLLSLSCAFSSYAWRISTKKNKKLRETLKENPTFPPITSWPLYQSFNSRLPLYTAFWMTERGFLLLHKPETPTDILCWVPVNSCSPLRWQYLKPKAAWAQQKDKSLQLFGSSALKLLPDP